MKTIVLIALMTVPVLGIAKEPPITVRPATGQPPSVVLSVDPDGSTVTINEASQTKLYHMDPFGTVYLNGAAASLKQLGAGMEVTSLSLSDPTTITEIKVIETAQPATAQTGAQYQSTIPAPELAALMAKVGNSYWSSSPTVWVYLAADGNLVDGYHEHWLGKWTLSDRYTLVLMDNARQKSGSQSPTLIKFNASYTVAGNLVRQPVPTAEMQSKVARLNP
jgi:hypothetical protein